MTGGGAAGDGIGNGRAAAILLARAGTRVLVVDRDVRAGRAHGGDDRGRGRHAAAHQADITDVAAVPRRWSPPRVDRFGRLDFLDNNVGIGSRGSVVDETAGELAPRHAGQRRARCSSPPSTRFPP